MIYDVSLRISNTLNNLSKNRFGCVIARTETINGMKTQNFPALISQCSVQYSIGFCRGYVFVWNTQDAADHKSFKIIKIGIVIV